MPKLSRGWGPPLCCVPAGGTPHPAAGGHQLPLSLPDSRALCPPRTSPPKQGAALHPHMLPPCSPRAFLALQGAADHPLLLPPLQGAADPQTCPPRAPPAGRRRHHAVRGQRACPLWAPGASQARRQPAPTLCRRGGRAGETPCIEGVGLGFLGFRVLINPKNPKPSGVDVPVRPHA